VTKTFEEIDRSECLRLLAGEQLGRLGVVIDGTPLILPMQFALDGDRVVLSTNPGAKFHSAPLANVSFEVDHADFDRELGWSVIIQGVAQDITNAIDDRSEKLRALKVSPWAPDPKTCWLTIIPRAITGRRIVEI
jgi:nitroimidazol reductase NimA-like FMN-containing flavoprotein (pyridoxamine 5'-phosphate oxidase superfamily)